MLKISTLFTILLICSSARAQILIFTYAFNRPDFIEIQHKTLKKFLLEEYEFVVFNDAKNPDLEKQINLMCAHLGIQCIRIPQEIHTQPYLPRLEGEDRNHPTVRNVNVVQYSLNTLGFNHDDIVILLDSDLFLVKPFSAREFLNGYSLGGAKTGNGYVEFLWHALALLDMRIMPNKRSLTFNCGRVDGHPIDGGGHSYYYIKNNPEAKVRFMTTHFHSDSLRCESCKLKKEPLCSHNTETLKAHGFDDVLIKFIQHANDVEFFHNNSFLHYRSGSNWNAKDAAYHQKKTDALNRFLTAILE